MTSMPLGNVRDTAVNLTASQTAAANFGKREDFLAVWNRQTVQSTDTDSGRKPGAQKETEKVGDGRKTDAAENGKFTEKSETTVDKPFSDEPTVQAEQPEQPVTDSEAEETGEAAGPDLEQEDAMSPGKLEAAVELLSSMMVSFVRQVAEELGITQEELKDLLGTLGMSEADLLQPESLAQFILAAGGEKDMMSLITNEGLYESFKDLMGQAQGGLEACGTELGLEPEQLEGILRQVQVQEPEQEHAVIPGEMRPMEPEEPIVYLEEEAAPEERETTEVKGEKEPKEVNGQIVPGQEETIRPQEAREASNKDGFGQKRQETSADRGQNGNPFLQNLTEVLQRTDSLGTDYSAMVPETDTDMIMHQIMDYMKVQVQPDLSSLEMLLHPESLGTLHIQLTSREGAMTAQFIAQNETVKAALESQMVQLKEQFQEQGIKVDAIEVMVQTHEFERNLDQGRKQGQEEAGRKARARRLNLNISGDGLDSLDMGEMTEEEQIAMEMMAAGGNTVDYTA